MKPVSVEYAHIYANAGIGEEQTVSVEALATIAEPDRSLAVLVDDYSFSDRGFDYPAFVSWLAERGSAPDVLIRESRLVPLCDEVLGMIGDASLREELTAYVRAKKYPCSLFIAAWYLLRLGRLSHEDFPSAEYADRLVNILHERFRPFEERARAILQATPHADYLLRIENRYFA